jgi:hypothetical protein
MDSASSTARLPGLHPFNMCSAQDVKRIEVRTPFVACPGGSVSLLVTAVRIGRLVFTRPCDAT